MELNFSDGGTPPPQVGLKAPPRQPQRERTIIGIADSMVLFITGVKQEIVSAPNGQKVLHDTREDHAVKLTSTPIGGYVMGGGCAFTLTEHWCKKKKVDFDKTVEDLKMQDGYALRFAFEDDEAIQQNGQPAYSRILAQIKHRHDTERGVQNEAYEVGILHSDDAFPTDPR